MIQSIFSIALALIPNDSAIPDPPFEWLDQVAADVAPLFAEAKPEALQESLPAWVELLKIRLGLENEEDAAPPSEEIAALRAEVAALTDTTRAMQQTLDLYLSTQLSQLREENESLREELKRLYAGGAKAAKNVPRPGGALYDALLEEALAEPPLEEEPPAPAGPDEPVIVSEWERSPEQVAKLPGKVPSLKGIVLYVSPQLTADELLALGRDMRAKYEGYDNINIEVFNDREAAESFAEKNVSSGPEHRVMNVSKHAATGRDTIFLLDTSGKATEFPALLGGEAAP